MRKKKTKIILGAASYESQKKKDIAIAMIFMLILVYLFAFKL